MSGWQAKSSGISQRIKFQSLIGIGTKFITTGLWLVKETCLNWASVQYTQKIDHFQRIQVPCKVPSFQQAFLVKEVLTFKQIIIEKRPLLVRILKIDYTQKEWKTDEKNDCLSQGYHDKLTYCKVNINCFLQNSQLSVVLFWDQSVSWQIFMVTTGFNILKLFVNDSILI